MQQSTSKTNQSPRHSSPTLSRKLDEIAAKLDQLCGVESAGLTNIQKPILLSQAEVCSCSGISRQQISNMISRGEFPAPVQLVGRRRAWRLADFQAWVSSRPVVGKKANEWNRSDSIE